MVTDAAAPGRSESDAGVTRSHGAALRGALRRAIAGRPRASSDSPSAEAETTIAEVPTFVTSTRWVAAPLSATRDGAAEMDTSGRAAPAPAGAAGASTV